MNTAALSFAERSALNAEALRRARELRDEAIVNGWDALFGLFARLALRGPRTLASRSDAATRPPPARPAG